MTTITLRRGLPRTPGGGPWPPVAEAETTLAVATPAPSMTAPEPEPAPAAPAAVAETVETRQVAVDQQLRRGLPRTPGGEPWPPATVTVQVAVPAVAPAEPEATAPAAPKLETVTEEVALRRGLPRVPGGAPWPEVASAQVTSTRPVAAAPEPAPEPEPEPVAEPTPTPVAASAPAPAAKPALAVDKQEQEAKGYGKWIGGALGLLALGAIAMVIARWFLGSSAGESFLERYPGHAPMPDSAPVGVPAWLAWSHFFNVFLMVLIIRSGLQIRRERRPPAYFTPRSGKGKISLTICFHQSLDLLWVVNGAVFFVLLFATGQWMRIVPTSWEVFPNAVSAAIQYVSFDWPTENGWVHYNALQQLAYFLTVFVAAPLAIATGVRMSSLWPKDNQRLNAVYPAELARKVHFPVMLYFVMFIVVHVLLVFLTGALRNLNHMFAAQGSVDPSTYAGNWTGFLLLLVAVAVTAGAWFAARPVVLSPIASAFGEVTTR